MHPRSHHWHQIDFVITRQRDAQDPYQGVSRHYCLLKPQDALIQSGPLNETSYVQPSTGTIRKKFNVRKLQEPTEKEEQVNCLDEKLHDLSPMRQDVEGYWTQLRDIMSETAEAVLRFAKRAHHD